MQAIVLAGGKGERLWPFTMNLPKAMVRVAGQPLLLHHLDWLERQGVTNAILACGYKASIIIDFLTTNPRDHLDTQFSLEDSPLGRGGAIKQATLLLPRSAEPAILSQGDIITDIPIGEAVESHLASDAVLTMVLVPYRSRFGVAEVGSDGFVRTFREKPRLPYWANTGIFVASPEFYQHLPDVGDEDDALRRLSEDHRVGAFCTPYYWRSVDTPKDITEAESDLALPSLPHESIFNPAPSE